MSNRVDNIATGVVFALAVALLAAFTYVRLTGHDQHHDHNHGVNHDHTHDMAECRKLSPSRRPGESMDQALARHARNGCGRLKQAQ